MVPNVSPPTWTPARSWLLAALSICSLVLLRIARGGVDNYGSDGAEYIEHSARLAVVRHMRNADWTAPWDLLVGADQSFPPLLHVLTGAVGEWTSHSATAAASTSVFWLLLLSVAVGGVTTEITARRSTGYVAATGLLLLPAAHGFATRYYYDLPMTALLWSSAAVFLRYRQRAPLLGGGAAGLIFASAALTKWPALAFGIPILAGALICQASDGQARWLNRSVALGSGALVSSGLLASFLATRGDDTSLARMTRVGLDSAPPHTWTAEWEGPLGLVVRTLSSRLGAFGLEDVTFYFLRAASSVFSPLLAILAATLFARWLMKGRLGWRLIGAVLIGHSAFLLAVVPVLDDRFLLPAAPVAVIAAAIGWSGLSSRSRRFVGAATLAIGLGVALDFHAGPPAAYNRPVVLAAGDGDKVPCTLARGLGAAGSVENRGWSRADSVAASADRCGTVRPRARNAYRDLVWPAIERCSPPRLGIPVEAPLFTPQGDKEWFTYRSRLGELTESRQATGVVAICPSEGHEPFTGPLPPLVVYGAQAGFPPCLDPDNWIALPQLPDPSGAPPAVILRDQSSEPCSP